MSNINFNTVRKVIGYSLIATGITGMIVANIACNNALNALSDSKVNELANDIERLSNNVIDRLNKYATDCITLINEDNEYVNEYVLDINPNFNSDSLELYDVMSKYFTRNSKRFDDCFKNYDKFKNIFSRKKMINVLVNDLSAYKSELEFVWDACNHLDEDKTGELRYNPKWMVNVLQCNDFMSSAKN